MSCSDTYKITQIKVSKGWFTELDFYWLMDGGIAEYFF